MGKTLLFFVSALFLCQEKLPLPEIKIIFYEPAVC
jgi:hypothetical protein